MSILFTTVDHGIIKGFRNQKCHAQSIYALIGDVKKFIIKRLSYNSDASDSLMIKDNSDICAKATKSFANSNGQYLTLHGVHENPFTLLEWMKINNYTFESDSRQIKVTYTNHQTAHIVGNLTEVSAAFNYIFYDKSALDLFLSKAKALLPPDTDILFYKDK